MSRLTSQSFLLKLLIDDAENTVLSPVHTSNNVDIVAKNCNNVEATFDIVAFDNVASTLLLVLTGL